MSDFKKITEEQLETRFRLRQTPDPKSDPLGFERLVAIHKKFKDLAASIIGNTPVCPEQFRALNALDESLFLTKAAIERTEIF